MNHFPVIDFSTCGLGVERHLLESEAMARAGEQIRSALSTSGFCYLRGHGIDQTAVDHYMDVSREFFQLPVKEKEKYARGTDTNFGWVALEREKLNPERPGDLKEAFNFDFLDDDSSKWPNKAFEVTSHDMFHGCWQLAYRVCDVLSVGLGLEEDFLRNAHKNIGKKGNYTTLRSSYYPPIPDDSSLKPGQIRLGEHSDYGTITLLFQDDVGGLEVDVPGVGFVPATPIPGTVIVNIGDMMQHWTADALKATKHRVLIPEAEIKKRTCRQSVAFFLQPDHDYIIECLDGSNKYEPISSLDYVNSKFSVTY